ncbi:hypothetical protein [Methylobacterium sp. J-072]|uniref:hypothetical protein n=1 Tax=Methylobacterium sp. J-072 TaxID=2836651 RepID=UPI0024440EC6|nr:hypothetical protein [Methylobacterium sp. J-072]
MTRAIRLRRRVGIKDRGTETEALRRRQRNERHVHAPNGDERTSASGTDLLFTAAETTRMPQFVTNVNLPDNPIAFANRAFRDLCGQGADASIGRNCRFPQGPNRHRRAPASSSAKTFRTAATDGEK